MTPGETAALLTYIGTVDDRLNLADPALAEGRIRAWAGILEGVDSRFAVDHVKRYYSKAGQPKVTPSEIRTAWAARIRREDALTTPAPPRSTAPPRGLREYLRAVTAAVAAGDDPTSVPVPPGHGLPPEADVASRRCRNWRGCACPHTKCRDGWLDAEERIVNGLGKGYPAVRACPHCKDAALMAAELAAPVRPRPRR